ncbi:MAG: SirB2 family protein [Pseudomonadota bacterium]
MSLIALYPQIKSAHIGLALCSGAFFALRGVAVLAGARWPQAALVRHASMLIDTALLVAALMLLAALHLNPFATPWLLAKLGLLVAYVVLGVMALRRARTTAGRASAFLAALGCYGAMVSIARTHHPLGYLA